MFEPNWADPRLARWSFRAELHRGRCTRRGELDDPEAVVEGEVRVRPPAEPGIEGLRLVHVGYGDDDGLELEVLDRVGDDARRAGGYCGGAHLILLLGCLCGDTEEPPPRTPRSHQ